MAGMSEKTRDFVLPGGGLLAAGPVAPGVGEIDPDWARRAVAQRMAEAEEAGEALEGLAEALEPQRERETRSRAAQAEREDARSQDAGFRMLVQELCDTWGGAGDDEEQEGKSGLELTLCRLDKTSGPEKSVLVQKWSFGPDELRRMTPDLEAMAMDYAHETGAFGPYAFRIKAWQRGELVKATTLRLHIAQPAGYKPPTVEAPKPEPVPAPNPMEALKETLGMAALFKDALGLGGQSKGTDPATLEAIRSSAAFQARYEAGEQYRRELKELEDRHRRELDEAKNAEYERGRRDGERDTRHEMERRIWDLEHQAPEGGGIVSEIVAAVGGPETLGGLIKAGSSWMQAQARRPAAVLPARIRPSVRPNPEPTENIQQLRVNAPGEPTREEWLEAVQTLEDAREVVKAQPADENTKGLYTQLSSLRAQAMGSGTLAPWWKAINEPTIPSPEGPISWLEFAHRIAESEQEEEPEAPMNIEHLKGRMNHHLEAGTATPEILQELAAQVPEETLKEWRNMLRFIPTAGALAFLGIPEHLKERGAEVLEAFKGA